MKPGLSRFLRASTALLAILGATGGTTGLAWYMTSRSTAARQAEVLSQAHTIVNGLAAAYAEQIGRHVLALDQTLDLIAREWEADPRGFNLETIRARSRILDGIARDMILIDENGVVRQASVPEAVGRNAGDLDVFVEAAKTAADKPKLILGGAAVNPLMRQWHIDAARALHRADGSFGGIVDADYRVAAIQAVFEASRPPGNGYAALIDISGGKLRALTGPAMVSPDGSIAETPMFEAADSRPSGVWTGPSAVDAVTRIHAFRRVRGTNLAVTAGIDLRETMAPVENWKRQSWIFCGAIAFLSLATATLILFGLGAGRRRATRAREHKALLDAADARAEVARADSESAALRLRATFLALRDGVAIFDAHLNLVDWNSPFPERSGVNASLIRTGMPMEDILRVQIREGYFGMPDNIGEAVDMEVERRTALMRAGNFGTSISFQARGQTVEMRCRSLPEGGFVALYADVTETRRTRQDLRAARDRLERQEGARARLLGAIAHEIGERATRLVRVLTSKSPASERAQDTHASIDSIAASLAGLAAGTAEIAQMQTGHVTARPEMIAVAPILREIVEATRIETEERGLTVWLTVSPAAPPELIGDPTRIRQIATLLVTEASRRASPDTMWLMAEPGGDGIALRLIVRGFGGPIPETGGGEFPGFDTVVVPETAETPGTGLGLAFARHLAMAIGARLRHETWATPHGRSGNDFLLEFPVAFLPGQTGRAPGQAPATGRPLPRTRILTIEAPSGLRAATATMLRRDGHKVELANNWDSALRILGSEPFDIVFFDPALPGRKAEVAVAEIRALPGPTRGVPLVAMARPADDLEARAWDLAGVTDTLDAAPAFADLVAAIDRDVWRAHRSGQRFGSMVVWDEDSEDGVPILDTDRIDELRVQLTPEELTAQIDACLADLRHRLPAFRRVLLAQTGAAITAQAQAMAGIAAGFGLSVLEARLRAIQAAVREQRLHTIYGAPEVIEADIERAAERLVRAARRGTRTRVDVSTRTDP